MVYIYFKLSGSSDSSGSDSESSYSSSSDDSSHAKTATKSGINKNRDRMLNEKRKLSKKGIE